MMVYLLAKYEINDEKEEAVKGSQSEQNRSEMKDSVKSNVNESQRQEE